jgi:hypothetical protein
VSDVDVFSFVELITGLEQNYALDLGSRDKSCHQFLGSTGEK